MLLRLAPLFFAVLCLPLPAMAQENIWQGANGDSWNNAANWSLGVVPSAPQDAVIDGGLAVLPANASAGRIIVRQGTLSWSGGDLSCPVQIDSGGLFDLAGSADKRFYHAFTNAGTVRVAGTGKVLSAVLGGSGTFTNQASGLIELASDTTFASDPSSVDYRFILTNQGTIRKSAGAASSNSVLELDSSSSHTGNIEVQQGNLDFARGFTSDGSVSLAAGTELRTISLTLGAAAQFQGPGLVRTGSPNAGFPYFYGWGTYAGSAPLVWDQTPVTGSFVVASGATMLVTGSGEHPLAGTIQVAGTLRWTGTGSIVSSAQLPSGSLEILPGGLFELLSDAIFTSAPNSPTAHLTLVNAGTVRKTAGAPTGASVLRLDFDSIHTGSMEVLQGNLEFPLGLRTSGSISVAAGSQCRVNGSLSMLPDAIFHGPGQVRAGYDGESQAFLSLSGTYLGSAPLVWQGGSLAGEWTVGSGADFAVTGSGDHQLLFCTIHVAGTMLWTGTGRIVSLADTFPSTIDILSSGLLDLHSDSTLTPLPENQMSRLVLTNAGTIRKNAGSGGASALLLSLGSVNTGSIQVLQGHLEFPYGLESDGSVTVAAGSECRIDGYIRMGALATWSGAGSVLAGYAASYGPYLSVTGTYRGSAELVWRSGRLAGEWSIGTDATLVVAGPDPHYLAGLIHNAGTIRWTGTGSVVGAFGFPIASGLDNLATGVVDLQSDAALLPDPGDFTSRLLLTNAGLVRKSAGSGAAASSFRLSFGSSNQGSYQVLQGNLAFPFGFESSGSAQLAAGTEIRVDQSFRLLAGAVFQGPGVVRLGGSEAFTPNVSMSGTYVGSAPLHWEEGSLVGEWTVGSGASLVISGTSAHYLSGTLHNAGIILWQGSGGVFGTSTFGAGGPLVHNLPGGLMELFSDSVLTAEASSFLNRIYLNNEGTLRKSGGSSPGVSVLRVDYGSSSTGTIEVAQGRLELAGLYINGPVKAPLGRECWLTGAVAFGAQADFMGPAPVKLAAGDDLAGSYLSLAGTYRGNAQLLWEKGSVGGVWTLPSGSQLRLAGADSRELFGGSLRIEGTVIWEGTGEVRISAVPLPGPALLVVAEGGLLDLRSDALLTAPNGPMDPVLLELRGTMRKSVGAAAPASSVLQLPSIQSASGAKLEVLAGTLSFPNGLTHYGAGEILLSGTTLRAPDVRVYGGVLGGFGVIEANVDNQSALRPGQGLSPGTLTITGNFTQGPMAETQLRVGHVGGVSDRLDLQAAATVAGGLRVNLFDMPPPVGANFEVIRLLAGKGSSGGPIYVIDPKLPPGLSFGAFPGPTSVRLVVRATLQAWRDFYFGAEAGNPLIAGDTADPNGNGLPNLLEFAFGLDPLSPLFDSASMRMPRLGLELQPGDNLPRLTFSYTRRIGAEGTGLNYIVESCGALGGAWDASGAGLESAGDPVPDDDGVTERVKVRTVAPFGTSPIHFLRLRVIEL